MKIIIGLGNPNSKYKKNRHNTGFQFLDYLNLGDFVLEKKFKSEILRKNIDGTDVIFVKPLTFMNKSGEAVSLIKNFYKVDLKDMLVVYDDLDLPIGKIRYRNEGSAGTHNGMKSIIEMLGDSNFPRLRFGIESRGEMLSDKIETTDFVLGNFTSEEKKLIEKAFKEGKKEMKKFLRKGLEP